ncbi:MAG: RluA family pseudouridine synthase [Sulfurospirillum sp.]
MGYVRKKFQIKKPVKAYVFLIKEFGCGMSEAQKWIDRGRIYENGKLVKIKNSLLLGSIEVIFFEPEPIGLQPIYENTHFAVFDKPSGIMIHPKMLDSEKTLNDDIKSYFGKNANAVHRIDKCTSGLVLVGKDKNSERELKKLFADRLVKKKYKALVFGKVDKNFRIEANLKSNLPSSKVRIKSHIDSSGKVSITDIKPVRYIKPLDMSIVEASPLTGRTHQIRAHLFHVKHSIVGDPIYGVDEDDADRFLNSDMSETERLKLSGASRLMLHADFLSFVYKGIEYNIKSEIDFERLVNEYCSSKRQ